ncbi:GNAT family N-acetyltransferase [Mariniflexile ostreae]|uniref:GNAT family N-acetyltransferase n=1 Tax=Mariniflexile ostreae TaxID=1520892 RepID=A0ABV5FFL9_9FLAO
MIRKATLADLKRIHDIEVLSFDKGSYPLFVLRQFFDISEPYFLVAEEQNEILGYALGHLIKKSGQGWVLSMCVHPDARGHNIGKKLIKRLVEILENNLSNEICLTVHPDNFSAIKIYQNLGFEHVLTSEDYYLDHDVRLVMKKQSLIHRMHS